MGHWTVLWGIGQSCGGIGQSCGGIGQSCGGIGQSCGALDSLVGHWTVLWGIGQSCGALDSLVGHWTVVWGHWTVLTLYPMRNGMESKERVRSGIGGGFPKVFRDGRAVKNCLFGTGFISHEVYCLNLQVEDRILRQLSTQQASVMSSY